MDNRPFPDQPEPAPAPPTVVSQSPLTPVRVMVLTLSVLFVLGLVWLLIQVRSILLLLILGILLAAAVEPLVNRLRRRGFSRGQGILAVYAGIFAVLGLAGYLIVPELYEQGQQFWSNVPTLLQDFRQQSATSANGFIRTAGTTALDRAIDLYNNPSETVRLQAVQVTEAISVVTSVFGILFTTVSVMIVAFYWMTEKALIKRLVLGLFPLERRDRAHDLWDQIEGKLGGWARGQLILMIVIGVLSTIAYSPLVLDLEFWFLLGIFAGLTELIPFVGPVIGGALAVVVALTDSWQKALIVVAFVAVLQQVEGSYLVPRIMRDAVGLTPLTVFLALLVGGALGGPVGAVLAIPVAAAIQVLVQNLLRSREEGVDTGATGAAVAATFTGRPQAIRDGGVGRGAAEPVAPFAAVETRGRPAAAGTTREPGQGR
ncbi:MAG: AI-2E family transporter [Chloroflexota bacterium]|nr:AI-2E family transporter [Chloroflexota bacterium]